MGLFHLPYTKNHLLLATKFLNQELSHISLYTSNTDLKLAAVQAMESADIPEGTEEYCSSNESGWTMYIGSPWHELDHIKGDDNYSSDNYHVSDEVNGNKDVYGSKDSGDNNNNGDSDDSLTSDACSGKRNFKYTAKAVAGNKKKSAAMKMQQKEEAKECGKNVKVTREDALRANKSSCGRHSRSFLQKK